MFPLPPAQQTSVKRKGTGESSATPVLLAVDLPALLPTCTPKVPAVSEALQLSAAMYNTTCGRQRRPK